ncbi:MAG TPA: hypothetical protein VGS96_10380 [Thermoanaerobaculia bacterium]|jgi:uncharacterized protein (DUF3084 family)|nr:hypothetical protein [Thermoanaerobaculia bacterium]
MLQTILILAAVIIVAALTFNLWKRMAADGMQRLNDGRRDSCRIVGRGELIDGTRHIPVALALSASTLYYENADLSASLDLEYVEEVEYDDELMIGRAVAAGKVMRLRCFSKVFEFILDAATAPQWQAMLPAVRTAR